MDPPVNAIATEVVRLRVERGTCEQHVDVSESCVL